MIRNVVPREREIGGLFIKGRNSHCRENQIHIFCWQFKFMTPSAQERQEIGAASHGTLAGIRVSGRM